MPYVERDQSGNIVTISKRPLYDGQEFVLHNAPEIISGHYRDRSAVRSEKYNEVGATTEKMVAALWEMVVEKRPESANAIQAKRQQVKAEIQ